jgi:hypothetical protein
MFRINWGELDYQSKDINILNKKENINFAIEKEES